MSQCPGARPTPFLCHFQRQVFVAGSQATWVSDLVLPLPYCVTVGKFGILSVDLSFLICRTVARIWLA